MSLEWSDVENFPEYSGNHQTQGKGGDIIHHTSWLSWFKSDFISFKVLKVAIMCLNLFWDVETLWGLLTPNLPPPPGLSMTSSGSWASSWQTSSAHKTKILSRVSTTVQCMKVGSGGRRINGNFQVKSLVISDIYKWLYNCEYYRHDGRYYSNFI